MAHCAAALGVTPLHVTTSPLPLGHSFFSFQFHFSTRLIEECSSLVSHSSVFSAGVLCLVTTKNEAHRHRDEQSEIKLEAGVGGGLQEAAWVGEAGWQDLPLKIAWL